MSNQLKTRNGIPFDFVDGLRIKGVDVTNWDKVFIDQGASYVGFKPAGNITASNVQAAIEELDSEKLAKTDLVTQSVNGVMSATDKAKLDNMATSGVVKTATVLRPGANQGIVWDNDAFGGTQDTASITLETASGEATKMRFKMTNDSDDNFEFTAKTADGLTVFNNAMTLNGNVILNAANYVDYSAPMIVDYVALRAYVGNATQVRITSNGIAGFFYYDSADSTSVDNGGTIIVSSNGRRWKRIYDGAVNVKWFGAKGNGSDDDTSSIQKAIDASGYAITFDEVPNHYKITATLLVGFGKKLSGNNARIVQYTSNIPILGVVSSKWKISDFRFEYAVQQSSTDTAAMGVTFNGAFEGEFTNSTITKAYKGFGVSVATSFAYECTFRNIRVIDAYDYGVSFDVNGSIGLTTNTFDNVYVLQTEAVTASPASKGFLIQYHTGGFVMRNCAGDKLQGGILLFIKGCSGGRVDVLYGELNTMKPNLGLVLIDASTDINIEGYTPTSNVGILSAGQVASFVKITGSSRNIKITGRENATNVTGNAGTLYGIDCNSTDASIKVDAFSFRVDSGFARLDALITGSYYQIWSYNGFELQTLLNGKRTQSRSAVPVSGTWVQGDTVINSAVSTSSPIGEWRCIIAGSPGTWRPFYWTVFRGDSSARPVLATQDIGIMFLDNTLDVDGKPIWWTGTSWVDSTGAAV